MFVLRRLLGLVAAAVLLAARPAWADFVAGISAYLANDYEAAMRLWTMAVERGDPRGHYGLGLIHLNGPEGQRDPARAAATFERAAEAGYALAQQALADLYVLGAGVPRDEERACRLWQAAARQDLAPAQFNLGRCYEHGIAFEEDLDQARHWYGAAVRGGFSAALPRLQALEAGHEAAGKAAPAEDALAAPVPAEAETAPAAAPPADPAATADDIPAATAAPAADEPAPAPAVPAGPHVWLASVFDEAQVDSEWRRLVRLYRPHLDGRTRTVTRAELGQDRTAYRLFAGPLPPAEAEALCAHIKTLNPKFACILRNRP